MENPKSIKVFNQFNVPPSIPNPIGDGTIPVFDYVEDKETGDVVYKEVGRSNIYELIQASKDSTDINYIVDRVAKGDTSLLNAKKGLFVDTTELPKDVFELGEMSKTIKSAYENDALLRELYPSFADYEAEFIEGKVFDKYLNAAKEKAEKEAAAAAALAAGGKEE